MDSKLLELHFSQLIKVWHKSKNNNFSDSGKQNYNLQLQKIFNELKKEDFSTKTKDEIYLRHQVLNFFFKSLEFLDNSTLSLIPYELIECLRFSLNEWLDDSDTFIIVTSMNNSIDVYSFDQTLIENEFIYDVIEKTFGVKFDNKLIQINLPKYLARDYLANVVLYHELGHFVDLKYKITITIFHEIAPKVINPLLFTATERTFINQFFPYLLDSSINIDARLYFFNNHLKEYFSDLFASQYIEKASNYYLDYVTFSDNTYHPSHPSTTNRILLVNDFISNINNFIVDLILEATFKITNRKIKQRFIYLDISDFIELLPIQIEKDSHLSSLFITGWNIWLNELPHLKEKNKMDFDLKKSEGYQIINNLIEKSISNHVIETTWQKAE